MAAKLTASEVQEAQVTEIKNRAAVWGEIAGLITDVRGLVAFTRGKLEEVIQVASEVAIEEIQRRVRR